MIALLIHFARRNRALGWRKPAGGSLESWRALLARSEPQSPANNPTPGQVAVAAQGLAALGTALRDRTPEWEKARQSTRDRVAKPL
jgi:hypothetical protein